METGSWLMMTVYTLGMPGVFLSLVAANIGIPFPVQVSYVVAQHFIDTGRYSFTFMFVLLSAAHISGALGAYFAAGRLKEWVRRRAPGCRVIEDKVGVWFEKYGGPTVFACRFIGQVRPFSSYVAGHLGVSLTSFIVWTVVGSLLFNAIVMWLTSTAFSILGGFERSNALIVAALVLSLSGLGLLVRRSHYRTNDRDNETPQIQDGSQRK